MSDLFGNNIVVFSSRRLTQCGVRIEQYTNEKESVNGLFIVTVCIHDHMDNKDGIFSSLCTILTDLNNATLYICYRLLKIDLKLN